MANLSVSYGSAGDTVKKLQSDLNKLGYSLEVDGVFGTKTSAAVKDYQKKNKLVVDGIVGEKTWGSINSGLKALTNANTNKKNSSSSKSVNSPATKRPTYTKSKALTTAEKSLSEWEKNKPSEYSSAYSERIDEALNAILNREAFNYNISADPLYNQYRELYLKNGEKAMLDTVGAVSALSGGYGSSYAVTAGNQSYSDYINQLNSVALELRDRAFDGYENENEALRETLSLLRSSDSEDYEKYRDGVSDYYDTGDYLLKKVSDMSDDEYEKFVNEVKSWESDRDFSYKQYLQGVAEKQYAEEMAFKKQQAEQKQMNEDREYNLALAKLYSAKASSSSSSSKSSSTSKSKAADTKASTYYPKTYSNFVQDTGFTGILTKSEFSARSSVVKKYKSYEKYLKAMYKKYK